MTKPIWQPQPGPQKALIDCPLPEIFYGGARGGGKCLPLDEPVLTPFGWRSMGNIEPGSQVCNPNGSVSRVLAVHRPGTAQTWRVTFSDGAQTICDDGHIWLGKFVGHRIKRGDHMRLWRFADIRRKYAEDSDQRFLIPLTKPVTFTRSSYNRHGDQRPLDGYLLGILLGDGSLTGDSVRYATVNDEIDAAMAAFGTVRVDDGPNRRLVYCPDVLVGLRKLGLWGKGASDKAVPTAYLWADTATRWAVLQGLMDTDGTADSRGQCYFASCSEQLARDVQTLAWSLGFKATRWSKPTTHQDSHAVYIRGAEREQLFRLTRKRERAGTDAQAHHNVRRIVSIEDAGEREVACFQVDDPNGLFITRDFVVTHNTDGVLGKWALKERHYGKAFNAIMFRKTTTSADDAIERAKEILLPLGGKFNEQRLIFKMPNGGRMAFRYLERVADADQYQGRNVTDAWVEEAGQFASPAPIDRLNAVLRSPHGVPTQLILTANPGGAGQHWLSERFQLYPLPDKPTIVERALPDGDTQKAAVIPSRVWDNQLLLKQDPGYIKRLKMSGSESLVRAWLEGDWSAIEGAFFDCWSTEKHTLRPAALPERWTRFRSMDWGSAAPFSIGWWAVAADDWTHPDGMVIPRHSLIRYREWYGASEANVGLKMPAESVGAGIVEREKDDPNLSGGVLDPAAFAEDGGPSLAERIEKGARDAGGFLGLRRADNKRVAGKGALGGWDQMRSRMIGQNGRPLIYWFTTCTASIRTIPTLQHDEKRPEDLDTESEDHAADDARYACMSRPWTAPVEQGPQVRDRWAEAFEEQAVENWKVI